MSMPPPPPPPPGGPPPGYGASTGPSGPRAGFWVRFAAALLDGIIIGVVGALIQAIVGDIVGFFISTAIGFGYYGYFEGGPAGQTLGKKLLDIRVVRLADGGRWGGAPPCCGTCAATCPPFPVGSGTSGCSGTPRR